MIVVEKTRSNSDMSAPWLAKWSTSGFREEFSAAVPRRYPEDLKRT
ncbi:MAG: hypothetical protein U0835_10405 [Isosphaeraceae bacterium]